MKGKLFFTVLIVVFSTALFSFVEKEYPLRKTYAESITAADLKKHLSVIASDAYEGRETAKKGQHMTAEYIAKQFMSFGIPPIPYHESTMEHPETGYYQDVPLLEKSSGNGTVKNNTHTYIFGNDFYYMPGTPDVTVALAQIVFAGYGIQDSLYRDYDGMD